MRNSKGVVDLEELLNKIYDSEIKKLMKEVVDCYNIGAYRAAIILTWNVVLYDSYKKAKYLAENFEDNQARDIVSKIETNLRNGNIKREWDLIEKYIYEKFEMIDDIEYEKLDFIKRLRNMSAHLSMYNIKEKYFIPTAEDARMCIRNAVEIILSQPPILNKKAIEYVFNDVLSSYFPTLYNKFEGIVLKEYIEKGGKYFLKNLVKETIKRYLFGEETHENLKNLFLLLLRHRQKYFEDENVKKILDGVSSEKAIEKLICIIMEEPEILNYLSKGKVVLIKYFEEQLKKFESLPENWKELFPFLYIILKFHIDNEDFESIECYITEYIIYMNLRKLESYRIYTTHFTDELKKAFLKIAIEELLKLSTFDRAYRFINETLSPLLYLVKERKQLKDIFTNIEENDYKINQILESSHGMENVERVLEGVSKDVLIKNKDIIENFISNVCNAISKVGVFDRNIEDCRDYFTKKFLNF
jgi:hypothetical protein